MDKELHYTILDTPVGLIGLVADARGLMVLEYIFCTEKEYQEILQHKFPLRELKLDGELVNTAVTQIKEYFAGKRKKFTVPLNIQGTDFQRQVWQALVGITYGQTCSYEDIACTINNKAAVRAVGQANGKNPIAIIIPCHRVINKSGKLGGYSSGLEIKKWLLNWEAANSV